MPIAAAVDLADATTLRDLPTPLLGFHPVVSALAFRVALALDVSIDDLLAGRGVPQGTCPHCGKLPDFADEGTVTGPLIEGGV